MFSHLFRSAASPLRLRTVGILLTAFALTGCASQKARKRLEGVAKGWCETIRASQVIPVYPLTEDLVPGDVFLVQTPIAAEAKTYRDRGFLALDDRRTRLPDLDYRRVYFNGYWQWSNSFGATPHLPPGRAPSTPGTNGPVPGVLSADGIVPRAAFPTYTFEAQSGSGLALAVPVQGIPVGLNFLQADRVSGSVTISDAFSYAADESQLYANLTAWASRAEVRQVLAETVRRSERKPILLRVVSRVYLTGGVSVSLNRSGSLGGSGRGGFNAPNVSMLNEQGDVQSSYTNLLQVLSNTANRSLLAGVTNAASAGGSVQFVAASASSVSLQETFPRLLALGYLGFDVPVFAGGLLGAPIPTFQRLNGDVDSSRGQPLGSLTEDQARVQISFAALKALHEEDPGAALKVMERTTQQLRSPEFEQLVGEFAAIRALPAAEQAAKIGAVLGRFRTAVAQYVSVGGNTGISYNRFDSAFTRAYEARDQD